MPIPSGGSGLSIGTLSGSIELEDNASRELEQFERRVKSTSTTLGLLGDGLTFAGAGLSVVGTAFIGIAKESVSAVTELNEGIANVSTNVEGKLGPSMTAITTLMKKEVQSIAIETGKSTKDITKGLYEVTSVLGYTGDTFKQLKIAAMAGTAGLSTTSEAFTFLNAVTRGYGDTSEAATKKVANLGFEAVRLGKTTFPELSSAVGKMIPIAHLAGVSLEEVFGVIATATGVTGNTSQVVTQMVSAMNAFLKPGAAMKRLFEEQKVASGEALIAEKGLVGSLQLVAEFSERTKTPMMELLKRKEAFVLAAGLAGGAADSFSTKMISMGKAGQASSTALLDAYEKQTKGVNQAGFAWKQFRVEVEVAMQELGDVVLPVVMKIGHALRPLWEDIKTTMHWFEQLPTPIQVIPILIGPALVTAGTLIRVFSKNMATIIETGKLGWTFLTAQINTNTEALVANAAAQKAAALGVPFSARSSTAQVASMEAWKAGSSAELLGAGVVAEATASKVGILTKAMTGLRLAGTAVLEVLTGPVGITIALVTGAALLTGYAIGWDNVWSGVTKVVGVLKDAASWIGEVTGLTTVFNGLWKDTKDTLGLLGQTLGNVASTMKNQFIASWFDFKTIVFGVSTSLRDELILNLSIAGAMFEKLTGTMKGSFLAGLSAIAVEVLTINTPLRDFLAILALLESKLPAWAKNSQAAADSSDKLAVQAGLAYGALRLQYEGFNASGAGLSFYDAQTKKVITSVSTWDSILQKNQFTLNDAQTGYRQFGAAVKKAGDEIPSLTEKLKEYEDELKTLGKDGKPTAAQLTQAIQSHAFNPKELATFAQISEGALRLFENRLSTTTAAGKKSATALKELNGAMDELTETQKRQVQSDLQHGASVEKISNAYHLNQIAVRNYADELKELKTATDDVYKVSTKLAALEDAQDKDFTVNFVRSSIANVESRVNTIGKISSDLDERILQSRMTTSQKAIRQLELERDEAVNNIGDVGSAYDRLKGNITSYYDFLIQKERDDESFRLKMQKFEIVGNAFRKLSQLAGNTTFGKIFGGLAEGIDAFQNLSAETKRFQDLQKLAAQNHESVWKTSFAGVASYAVTSFATMYGAAQMGIDIIRKLKDTLTGPVYQAAINQRGGAGQIRTNAALAGFNPAPLLNATTNKQFQQQLALFDAAISASNDRLQKYGLTWKDFNSQIQKANISQTVRDLVKDFNQLKFTGANPQSIIRGMSGDLSQLVVDAVSTGQKIPVALQPMIETLIRSGNLSQDAARALLGMGTEAVPTFAEVEAAAGRYGIKLDSLGPKIKALELGETATKIAADWKTLISAGGDVNAVMVGMSGSVQTIINDAATAGVKIPASLRPIIEQMAKAGLLTDGFGNKLTDASQLDFETPLSEQFDTLISKLQELIDKFSKVGTAAEEGFGRARTAAGGVLTGEVGVPRNPTGTPAPAPAPAPTPAPAPAPGAPRAPAPTPAPTPTPPQGNPQPTPAPPPVAAPRRPTSTVLPGPENADPRMRFATGGMVTPLYLAAGSTSVGAPTGSLGTTSGRTRTDSPWITPIATGTRSAPPGSVSTYRGGPVGSDTVNAWLTPKEGVVTVEGMKELTESNLNLLNTKPGAFTTKVRMEGEEAYSAKVLPFIKQQQEQITETKAQLTQVGRLIQSLLEGFKGVISAAASGLPDIPPGAQPNVLPGDVITRPKPPGSSPIVVSDSGEVQTPPGWRPGQVPEGADPRFRYSTGGVVGEPVQTAPAVRENQWAGQYQGPQAEVHNHYANMFQGMTVTMEALPAFMERLADVLDIDGDLRLRMRNALQVKKSA